MDVTGNQRLYFLRRSIATLMEAAKAVTQLDGNPEFDAIRARFEGINAQRWRRAVRFFNRYGKNFITPIRHSIGGHFLLEAAKHAITELGEDTSGAIEIVVDGYGKGGFRLHFCRHLAGAALTHKVPGSAQYAIKFRRLFRTAHVGYHHVVRAVEALGYHDLWDRFS
jgi:hypothetical protein